MLRTIKSLIGFPMEASDGEIGKVEEFYFDDKTWNIRYLIVDTGNWLSGRKVLIAPSALVSISETAESLPVNLTKEQIRSSPDIDTDKPVSRRQEIELYGHYAWKSYWGSGFYAGGFWKANDAAVIDEERIKDLGNSDPRNPEDPHLRSTKLVNGYHIQAWDGDIGHVSDFVVNDQTWHIGSLLVDTHNWIGGKKVLIAIEHIKEIQWDQSKVLVELTSEAIKNSRKAEELNYIA
jgi:uncharacterized protein YrrD